MPWSNLNRLRAPRAVYVTVVSCTAGYSEIEDDGLGAIGSGEVWFCGGGEEFGLCQLPFNFPSITLPPVKCLGTVQL